MSLKWIFIITAIIIVFLYIRCDLSNGKDLRFVGLNPLISPLGSVESLLATVFVDPATPLNSKNSRDQRGHKSKTNYENVESDEEEEEQEVQEEVEGERQDEEHGEDQKIVIIPKTWNFSDIKGDLKRERIVKRVVETLYNKPFEKIRPPWLRNPETGRCLEYDMFNDELNLAVEHNGKQHYEQCSHFHKDRSAFLSQVRRDKYKKEMSIENGVDLIIVPYNIPIENIPNYIINKLTQLGRV